MKKRLIALLILVCSAAVMLGAAQEELLEVFNPNLFLLTAMSSRTTQTLAEKNSDFDYMKGAIMNVSYRDGEYRTAKGDDRKVVDAGTTSAKKTFDIGCGCGLSDDSLWYITLTFNDKTSHDSIIVNTYGLLLGASRVTGLGKDYNEQMQNAEDLMKEILGSSGDIAIEVNGQVVLFKKGIGGGKTIVGVNSKEFYDLFYKGTISNYLTIEFDESTVTYDSIVSGQ